MEILYRSIQYNSIDKALKGKKEGAVSNANLRAFATAPFLASPLCAFFLLVTIEVSFSSSDEELEKVAGIEGHKGVEIVVLARKSCVCGNEQEKEKHSRHKAPDTECPNEGKDHKAHKLEGVSELVVLLCKIGYRHESHIKYHVLA